MLDIPVVLGHLVEVVAAHDHGGHVDQAVQPAERIVGRRHERLVRRQVAQVRGARHVPLAVQPGDDGFTGVLVEVRHQQPRPGRGEPLAHRASDPARRARHDHALAVQAAAEVPAHDPPPSSVAGLVASSRVTSSSSKPRVFIHGLTLVSRWS